MQRAMQPRVGCCTTWSVWIVTLWIASADDRAAASQRFTVLEQQPAGSEVGTIRVDDVPRHLLEFAVRPTSPHARYFDVDRRTGL